MYHSGVGEVDNGGGYARMGVEGVWENLYTFPLILLRT